MRHLFRDYEEACDNTLLIAERAEVELEFGNAVLPTFPTPPVPTRTRYLRELTLEGARDALRRPACRSTSRSGSSTSSVSSRRWGSPRTSSSCGTSCATRARRGIRVGPGRGSAAGSCVAYCLRIVDIDPIRYDLLFERFLNPGRKQMPDIDMDFDSRYRGDLIRYAAERYGDDHVAQIITFSTIKARAAVRDAARVLGYPYLVGDKIAKLMPPLIMGRDTPLAACLDPQPKHEDGYKMAAELRELYEADPDAKRVDRRRAGPRGPASPGRHPRGRRRDHPRAAHRVPPDPAQAAGRWRSRVGARRHAVRDARRRGPRAPQDGLPRAPQPRRDRDHARPRRGDRGEPSRHRRRAARRREDLRDAPPRARPIGVFQLEGGPVRSLLRSLAPTTFEDIAALIALYRPGPDGPELAQRVRQPQERPEAGHVPAPRPRGDPRADVRADDLPGAADARRAAARRLHARGGRQPPQGDREEGP